MMKPRPTLSHMPYHINKRIVEQLRPFHQISFRSLSKQFRSIVKITKKHFEKVKFTIGREMISLKYDVFQETSPFFALHRLTSYHFHPEGCVVRDGDWERIVEGVDYLQAAIDDFILLVKNPGFYTRHLSFGCSRELIVGNCQDVVDAACLKVKCALEKLDTQLNVEVLAICDSTSFRDIFGDTVRIEDIVRIGDTVIIGDYMIRDIMDFLPYMKPGVLEAFDFACRTEEMMSTVIETPQWQQATRMLMRNGTDKYPISKMAHMSFLLLSGASWTLDDLKQMIQNGIQINYHFLYIFDFTHILDYPTVLEYFSQFPSRSGERNTYEIRYPNGENYVRVRMYNERSIEICNADGFPGDPEDI